MKKQKKLVVGNWKANPLSVDEAKNIVAVSKRAAGKVRRTQVVVCPPHIYISLFSKLRGGNIFLGAQDAFYEPHGHFTGEVTFAMLPQFKVSHVILGHSERRSAGETDATINKKLRSTVTEDMTAILCVGEKTRDTHGEYLELIRGQIVTALRDVQKKSLDKLVIAYEPVWAVGANTTPRPQEIHEMAIFIKKVLREVYGIAADGVSVLYGGDVTVGNVEEIIRDGFVQGVLIGRESLKPKDFSEIIKIVDNT